MKAGATLNNGSSQELVRLMINRRYIRKGARRVIESRAYKSLIVENKQGCLEGRVSARRVFQERRAVMLNFVRKVMLTGVGLAVMTKEKAEELGRELVEKGEITEKEGKEFVEELLKKSEETSKDFESKVEENVKKVMTRLNFTTKTEMDKLVERVAALEKGKAAGGEKQE
jgi:polyhydroxyalkanoate synthesis regulator phasin